MKVTAAMQKAAKPAAYTGTIFNRKTGKMKSICWPACRMPKAGLVVLMQRQCKSVEQAEELAKRELARRAEA